MNKWTKKLRVGILAGAIMSLLVVSRAYSEWKLQVLLNSQQKSLARPRFQNPQEMQAWMNAAKEHNRRLAALWMERNQRDITRDVLPFLKDAAQGIQQRAVMMLGHLESKQAQAPLQMMLEQGNGRGTASKPHGVPSLMLRLAIGRIKSHKLQGQAKLNAVARSVGLSWTEVVRLSQKVNAPNSYASGTEADEVVDEMVDVLYHLSKTGQDIRPWATQLQLSNAQQVLLRAASFSTQNEIKTLVDYLSHIQLLDEDTYNLTYHLIGLGGRSTTVVDTYLGKMQKNPSKYPQGVNYKAMFIASSGFNRRAAIPVIKKFEKSSNAYIVSQAVDAQMFIKNQLAVPIFPA